MKTLRIPALSISINLQDGTESTAQKLQGKFELNKTQNEAVFTQNPVRVKTTGKNPIIFSGNYMTARFHTVTGASQLTMRLGANTNVQEIRGELINEFIASLESISC